jgi:hypothetical protein
VDIARIILEGELIELWKMDLKEGALFTLRAEFSGGRLAPVGV